MATSSIRFVGLETLNETPLETPPCPKKVAGSVDFRQYTVRVDLLPSDELTDQEKETHLTKRDYILDPGCAGYKVTGMPTEQYAKECLGCQYFVLEHRNKLAKENKLPPSNLPQYGLPPLDLKIRDVSVLSIVRKVDRRALVLDMTDHGAQRFVEFLDGVSDDLLDSRLIVGFKEKNEETGKIQEVVNIHPGRVENGVCNPQMIAKIENGHSYGFGITMLTSYGEYQKGRNGRYPWFVHLVEPKASNEDERTLKERSVDILKSTEMLRPDVAIPRALYEADRIIHSREALVEA